MISAANHNSGGGTSSQSSGVGFSGTPVVHEAQVVATGARPGESSGKRELFTENTTTALVFPNGGVIRLSVAVVPGQLVFLNNQHNRREVVAQVTRRRDNPSAGYYVELEFTEPSPDFWGVKFPEVPAAAPASDPPPPAAELFQLSEPASDDLAPNAPAPSAAEVQALMDEVEVLREQLRSMQNQSASPAPQAPSAAAVVPTPHQDGIASTEAPATPPAASLVPSAAPALPALKLPKATEAPPVREENFAEEDDLLPKPALDFKKANAALKNPAVNQLPPRLSGDRLGSLRLALLAVVSVFAVTVAAWNMHWLPWLSPRSNAAEHGPLPNRPTAKPVAPTAAQTKHDASPAADSAGAAEADGTLPSGSPEASTGNTTAETVASSETRESVPAEPSKPGRARKEDSLTISAVAKRSNVSRSSDEEADPPAASAGSAGTTPPRLIKSVRAIAPGDALREFVTGNVTIDALIDKTGHVSAMKVLSGPQSFHKAALDALKQYRYSPALQNGKPVSAHLTVTVPFWFEP